MDTKNDTELTLDPANLLGVRELARPGSAPTLEAGHSGEERELSVRGIARLQSKVGDAELPFF